MKQYLMMAAVFALVCGWGSQLSAKSIEDRRLDSKTLTSTTVPANAVTNYGNYNPGQEVMGVDPQYRPVGQETWGVDPQYIRFNRALIYMGVDPQY